MTNMQHRNRIAFNRKQDSISVPRTAIQQLAHFKWKNFVFRSESATGWELAQGSDGFLHASKPP